jgi:hypothetical protein
MNKAFEEDNKSAKDTEDAIRTDFGWMFNISVHILWLTAFHLRQLP